MNLHRYRFSIIGRLAASIVAIALLAGCQSTPVASTTELTPDQAPRAILVWPVIDMAAIYGEQTSAKCPLSGKVFKTAERVPEDTLSVLAKQALESLKQLDGITVLPPGQARGAVSGLWEQNPQGLTPKQEMIEVARSVKADAVLVTAIYRFRQRVGNAYGVDRPASLAMSVYLFKSPSGQRLWSAQYDETQRSLLENLFQIDSFVKRKGVWVTADEMASGAMADMLARFPMH